MYTNTHAHALQCPHAEALILRPTIYAQICIHIHIHMCINVHIYIYIHTCTYIYIHVRAHTHIHIYTHTHTKCTYERTQSTSETTVRQRLRGKPNLMPRSSALLPVRCNPEGDTLRDQQPNCPSRGTTDSRRTTTTNSSSSHHRDSAPSRPHPLICTGAEPIHPVHGPPKLRAWPWPPETRSFFCHFGGFFQLIRSQLFRDLRTCLLHCHLSQFSHPIPPPPPTGPACLPATLPSTDRPGKNVVSNGSFTCVPLRVPGLPIRKCADVSNNLVTRDTKVSAIDVNAKAFFERLYLVPGLRKIAPLVTMPSAPNSPPLAMRLFLDFRAIFFRVVPHFFWSARFTK